MKNLTIGEKLLAIRMVILMFLNTIWQTLAGRIVIGALIIFIPLITLRSCLKSPNPEAPAEKIVLARDPTIDQALDAVIRTVSADQVCYDSAQNSYLMHWTRQPKADDEDQDSYEKKRDGWYSMADVTMYRSANDTWYIKDINSIPDVYVGVDVTGLPCKPGVGH